MRVRKWTTISVLVPLALLAVLTACGGVGGSNNNNNGGGTTPTPTTTEFLVVGNAGGGVSSFGIDSNTGALTQVSGSPFQPSSSVNRLALDPSGKVVYATILAGPPNLQSFTVNSSGVLTMSANTGFTGTPGAIAVDPTGKFAYILPDSSVNTPTVSAFSIDPSTHGFTPLAGQPTPVAGVGRDIAVDPSGKFVYITFLEPDGVTWAVAGRSRDATSGLLTPMPNSPFVLSGQDSRRIVVTPGNLVLVANFATSNISVLTLDPATGTLTPAPGSPVGTGVGPISLAVDPSGKFVFVANQGSNNVSVFSISGSTLTPVAGSPFFGGTNTGASPTAITVDPSGKFVYVTNGAGTAAAGSISAFSLNSSTGALTLVPSSPFLGGNGPQSAVVVTP